ncbi:MAG: efflux RND transporter periplasmic adaptor subunit [Terriglobia bacterium]
MVENASNPRKKKILALSVIALVLLVTIGMVIDSKSKDPKYLTATVRRGNITAVVQATGTINALTTVPVGSDVSGTVKYVFADFNTRVRAGQVLAQLDPTNYEAQVIEARGNLENAQANVQNLQASMVAQDAAIQTNQANLARLQAALKYAQVNEKRIVDLADQQIVSKDQSDLAVSTLDQSMAQVRAQEAQTTQSVAQLNQTKAQLAQSRAQVMVMTGALKQAEKNLADATIISPIDGTIVARNIDVGQSVAASFQAPNVFTIAQDLGHMQVDTATDESDTGNIKIGSEAAFQVDAFPTETFRGRVSAIRLNATTVQNVVTYDTVVNFENPDEKLLPGETAYVTIPTGEAKNTLMIPNAALRFTPTLSPQQLQGLYREYKIPHSAAAPHLGGAQVVWKLGPNKKLIPVAVKVGITDYSNTQLLSSGLEQGDTLVTGEELSGSGQFSNAVPGGPRFGGPHHH